MSIRATITGAKQVLRNLSAVDRSMARGYAIGLKKAGLLLQRTSQLRVPVEYGLLKASAYTRANGSGWGTSVTVGYTSEYAAFVHQLVDMKLQGTPRPSGLGPNYWDPAGRGQALFLSSAIQDKKDEAQQLLRAEVAKRFLF